MNQNLYRTGYERKLKKNILSNEERKFLEQQFDELDKLIEGINKENFWNTIPMIFGIDSKLGIFMELVNIDEISYNERLNIIENDYRNYYKELLGYGLSSPSEPLLIMNVL